MLHHDGYEFHNVDKRQYRYIGKIEITPRLVNWAAEITNDDINKGSINGSIFGIGDDEGTVRRAVDIEVKAKIQSLSIT
jgi:hypothetical protein